jgi:1,4-alpha-glucan branching enzyme
LEYATHIGLRQWVMDLNRLYRSEPALHELDCDSAGFAWVDCNDATNSVLSFLRHGKTSGATVLIVCNFTPVSRSNYRVGITRSGFWREILNSDAADYGGSRQGNLGGVAAVPVPYHGRPYSLNLMLPPLSVLFFKHEGE